MLFPIKRLLRGRRGLSKLPATATIREALKLMIERRYSVLPIVGADGKLLGVISEQSISHRLFHVPDGVIGLDMCVDHCMKEAVTFRDDADTLDVLNRLKDEFAVIITDADHIPRGIVTDYDTTSFFQDLSRGFVYVRDIELALRAYIERAFPTRQERDQAISAAGLFEGRKPKLKPKRYAKLGFDEQRKLIACAQNWPRFQGALEPLAHFDSLMTRTRDARNKLFHFRGALTAVELNLLLHTRTWLYTRPARPDELDRINDLGEGDAET